MMIGIYMILILISFSVGFVCVSLSEISRLLRDIILEIKSVDKFK